MIVIVDANNLFSASEITETDGSLGSCTVDVDCGCLGDCTLGW